jgi:hypothetical protein
MGKTNYRQNLAESGVMEDAEIIQQIEKMSVEEKERLNNQKFSIIKHRNAAHQELRVEAARLAKAKRKLEHDLLVAKSKIDKMQSQHERQLEYVKSTFQRKLDKLYRQLISKNQLSALEELAEESDIRKDLQKYCFEPYNWKPPAIEVEAVDDKKDAWAPIMQGLSSAEWAAPESLVAVSGEDAGKKNPTKAIADFHAYCLEPYTPAYSPAEMAATWDWPLSDQSKKQLGAELLGQKKECAALRISVPGDDEEQSTPWMPVDTAPKALPEAFPEQQGKPRTPLESMTQHAVAEIASCVEDWTSSCLEPYAWNPPNDLPHDTSLVPLMYAMLKVPTPPEAAEEPSPDLDPFTTAPCPVDPQDRPIAPYHQCFANTSIPPIGAAAPGAAWPVGASCATAVDPPQSLPMLPSAH